MRRQKTGVQFDIPILPELLAEIALHPMAGGQLASLVTEQGRPFTAAGLGGKFREWCNAAGLKHCSARAACAKPLRFTTRWTRQQRQN
jgi:hypothetical protein